MTLPSAAQLGDMFVTVLDAMDMASGLMRVGLVDAEMLERSNGQGDRAFTGVLAGFPMATNARKRASEWPLSPEDRLDPVVTYRTSFSRRRLDPRSRPRGCSLTSNRHA